MKKRDKHNSWVLWKKTNEKAGEAFAFWALLGFAAGVGTIAVATRWLSRWNKMALQVEEVPPVSPEPAPTPAVVAQPTTTETAVAEAAAQKPAATPKADKLTRIEGIGPKSAKLLQAAGIHSFQQLADTSPAQLKEILEEAKLPFIDPGTWPEQAALAAAGKWDELAALQDQLEGGRRVN